jgi:hypothetical protein
MAIPIEGLYTQKALGRGKIPKYNPNTNIRTKCNTDVAVIPFGLALMMDDEEPIGAQIYANVTGVFVGVSVNAVDTHETDSTEKAYEIGAAMGVIDQGPVMAYVMEDVAIGDPVRVVHTVSGDYSVGSFVKTAIPGSTVLLSGAKWDDAGSASGTAELYLGGIFAITADT